MVAPLRGEDENTLDGVGGGCNGCRRGWRCRQRPDADEPRLSDRQPAETRPHARSVGSCCRAVRRREDACRRGTQRDESSRGHAGQGRCCNSACLRGGHPPPAGLGQPAGILACRRKTPPGAKKTAAKPRQRARRARRDMRIPRIPITWVPRAHLVGRLCRPATRPGRRPLRTFTDFRRTIIPARANHQAPASVIFVAAAAATRRRGLLPDALVLVEAVAAPGFCSRTCR